MKRQRNDSSPQRPNQTKGGRRITFLRGENKITYVKVPPKSDNPKHWFKEGEAITTKPLNFIIPAESAVNMDISTNVTLKRMSVVLEDEANEKNNQKITMGSNKSNKLSSSSSSSSSIERCTLEVAMRDLESELNLARSAPKTKDSRSAKAEEERIVNANKFYAIGSCAYATTKAEGKNNASSSTYVPASHCVLKSSLINGIYVLRNSGTRPLAIMAMAVDVETKLQ